MDCLYLQYGYDRNCTAVSAHPDSTYSTASDEQSTSLRCLDVSARQKMYVRDYLAQQWSTLLECLISVLAFLPDEDVACLILIVTLYSAGGTSRDWLFDGFRCDCIKLFLHPQFLEFVCRTLEPAIRLWLVSAKRCLGRRITFSSASKPMMSGTLATLVCSYRDECPHR